jgi:O-antigen ligase
MAVVRISDMLTRQRILHIPVLLWHATNTDVITRVAGCFLSLLPALYLLGSGMADAIASIIAVLFLLHSKQHHHWTWLRQSWFICALALWMFMMIRGGFAHSPTIALQASLPWIRFPLFAMACAAWLLPHLRLRTYLLTCLRGVVIFLIVDTLFQYSIGVDILGRPTFPAFEGGIRLTGPFSSPKVGIVLAWLGLPVLLERLMDARSPHQRWQFASTLALGIAYLGAIFLSGERMAFLLAGFGGCIAIALQPTIMKRVLLPAIISLALGLMLVWSNPSLFTRQIDSTLQGIQHVQHTPYGMIWTSALKMIDAHPIVGVGARHFRIACPQPDYGAMDKAILAWRCNLHPHQFYLEWLSEGGIIGLGLVVLMLGFWIKHGIRCYRTYHQQGLWLGVVTALLLRLWPLSTGVSMFVGWSAVPFWLLAGWMLSYTATNHSERN